MVLVYYIIPRSGGDSFKRIFFIEITSKDFPINSLKNLIIEILIINYNDQDN